MEIGREKQSGSRNEVHVAAMLVAAQRPVRIARIDGDQVHLCVPHSPLCLRGVGE